MELDILDKRILYELERDASVPLSAIAKKVRRSKEVVNYRIGRLQREGIILGFHAIVDMSKLGYFTFRVYIRWQNMTAEEKAEFNTLLGRKKDIWTIAVLHGRWDIAFFIGIKSAELMTGFHEIWSWVQAKYKEKIAESKIAIYSPVHNFNKTFFMDGRFAVVERVYGRGTLAQTDEVDEAILRSYATNVRNSFAAIGDVVGITGEAVRRRIRKLERHDVIAGYKIDMDLSKLGYQGYRVDFSLNSTVRNSELFEYLKQHRYFYQVNKSIGGADFETEIVVEDLQHLLAILEDVVDRFRDVVRNYEYFGYSNFPKLSIVPD